MPVHHLEYLSREQYVNSIELIQDSKSLRFADMSLKWWDKKFGWYMKGCVALSDEQNNHLCYIFYMIDRYNEYITIHNIFTPLALRRNGYANTLLGMIFDIAVSQKVNRFRLTSISNSLDFYLSLGFVYWGVNSVGDYYCDRPLPQNGLNDLSNMIAGMDTTTLIGKSFEKIYAKVENNNIKLNEKQTLIYDRDLLKMKGHYLLERLITHKDER